MSYPYRCTHRHCRKRISLTRLLEHFDIDHRPKCPNCGRDSLKLDRGKRAQTKKDTCYCSAISHPHSKHTLGCKSNERPVTDEELEAEYYRIPFTSEGRK